MHRRGGGRDRRLEAREGGRWGERDAQGNECPWGRVLACEPPHRIVMAWQIDPDFKFDPDPARQTEVEVTFDAEGSRAHASRSSTAASRYGASAARYARFRELRGGWAGLLGMYAALTRGDIG